MVDEKNDNPTGYQDPKQPFVPQEDRPDMSFNPDRPVSELRVRDLITILGGAFSSRHGRAIEAKALYKELKPKSEFYKELKQEVWEHKLKNEKWEYIEIPVPREFPEPSPLDPRLDQLIETVSGLARRVGELGNQVEALQRQIGG